MDWNKSFPSNCIFVYNFPNEWMESDIKKNFIIFGAINNIIINRDINVFAFIQFNDSDSSQKSIDVMNGKEINGKILKVTNKKIPDDCLDITTTKLETQQKTQLSNENKKTTLFVFYLPPHWNDEDLFNKFKTFGNLESAKVAKKNDKTSKGYGFVVYTDPHSAALAMSNMNKVEVYTGKRLKVLLKSNSNKNNKKKIKRGCTIFVFYIPNDWSDKDLKRHFSHYGNIIGATVKRETNGKSRGYGFINFENQQSAINAVSGMNGFNAGNKYLKVSIKKGEEQFLSPQYLNMDRSINTNFTSPPPPPPLTCHANDSGSFNNNDIYSFPSTISNNHIGNNMSNSLNNNYYHRFNHATGNEIHQSFLTSHYGHFPYNYFKNNDKSTYLQRNYKNFNNTGKT